MTLFGKQVSVAVLISFVVSLVTTVGGAAVTIANNWGTTDPASLLVLALGLAGTTVSTIVHTWDTMPANVAK